MAHVSVRREEPGRCAGGARHVLDGARAHLDVVLMIEAKHGTSGKHCVLPQPLHAEISRLALQPLLAGCARGDPVATRRVARAVHEPQIPHSPVGQNRRGVEHGAYSPSVRERERRVGSQHGASRCGPCRARKRGGKNKEHATKGDSWLLASQRCPGMRRWLAGWRSRHPHGAPAFSMRAIPGSRPRSWPVTRAALLAARQAPVR